MVLSSSTEMPVVVEPAICAERFPPATTNITPMSTAVTVLCMSRLLAFRMSDGRGHERAPWHRRRVVRPPLVPTTHCTPMDCRPANTGKCIRQKPERDVSVMTRPAAKHGGTTSVHIVPPVVPTRPMDVPLPLLHAPPPCAILVCPCVPQDQHHVRDAVRVRPTAGPVGYPLRRGALDDPRPSSSPQPRASV